MTIELTGTFAETNKKTPGYTSEILRQSLLDIEPHMQNIGDIFKESFSILE